MQVDGVYEPVVVGQLLYLASSRQDSVTAYDTRTGEPRWSFFAEGPVRYAPTVAAGKLYFTSDDGFLYCLNAAKGNLVWKVRGGPNNRLVLGNERLISTWPARGAPAIADGKVYFAASIWPFMGTFIHCVDADTGAIIWTNDGDGSLYIKQPHNADSFAGVAPQGPLVVSGKNLLIPGGRSIPAVLDRDTGKFLRYQLAENGKKGGGAVVAAWGEYFFNGGSIFQTASEKHLAVLGDPLVLGDKHAYGFTAGAIKAYDLAGAKTETTESVDKKGEKTKTTKWQIKELAAVKQSKIEALVVAGQRLYAGRPGEVMAFDLPLAATSKPVWSVKVPGTPATLVPGDNRLFVATREGQVLCFGPDAVATAKVWQVEPSKENIDPHAVERAAELQKLAGATEGYAVLWGAGSVDLPLALTAGNSLRLIVVEADPARAFELRMRLMQRNVAAERIAVLVGTPQTVQLPPYFASAMWCDSAPRAGLKFDADTLGRLAQALRPYGGAAWLAGEAAGLTPPQLSGLVVKGDAAGVKLARPGALEGAGNWTHEHGDAANTRLARDKIVKAPLGLLWFGGPGNDDILPRHGHGPQPQVIDGRCIIEGVDMLRAIDIYTGRLLWETRLPGIGFFYNNLLHQPGANASGGNYVCTSDGIYVLLGSRVLRLDPATGKQIGEFQGPMLAGMKGPPRWGYLSIEGDLLVGGLDPVFDDKLFKDATIVKDEKGLADDTSDKKKDDAVTKLLKTLRANNDNLSSSKHLAVMDRQSGKVLWTATAQSGFRHNAICFGGDRVYCIDRLSGPEVARLKRRGEEPKYLPRLVVFDARTGKELWSTEVDVFGTWLSYSAKYDILVEAGRVARDTISDEPKGMRAYDAKSGKPLWHHASYVGPAMIHDRTIYKDLTGCDLITGAVKMRPHPLTGVPVPWEWFRNYGCNTPSASENLLMFRSGAAGFFDLCNDGGTGNIGGFRSSCTNNLIVAGGVVTCPEYTRTCSCLYQNQTSIGLIHLPEAELWTSFGTLELKGTVSRVGINLGAAGDRRADSGTFWLEYPSIGGKSPTLPVKVNGGKVEWFRRHSSQFEGPMNWVASSGVKNVESITVTLSKGSLEATKYTVRLYFAEPDNAKEGERVFDVKVQSRPALKAFDIVKVAGGPNRGVVREFTGVVALDTLTISFQAAQGSRGAVLCGVEIVAEQPRGKAE